MIGKEMELRILTLYHQEEKSINAIASSLSIHRSVVTRVLHKYEQQLGKRPPATGRQRTRLIDEYKPFIKAKLAENPDLTAARLFRMVKELGYPGGESQFRHEVAKLRGKKLPTAFLHVQTLPAEELQVDWADFGKVEVRGGQRRLYAAVFVLSYSRAIHATFSFGCKTHDLLYAQSQAFQWFNGVCHTSIYDNMKSVVLSRPDKNVAVYNESLIHFAKHYGFRIEVTGVRKPHHKGKVERAIQYLRSSFFQGTIWNSLEELNELVLHWCNTTALKRRWPDDRSLTVAEQLEKERGSLRKLPDTNYPCYEIAHAKAHKKHYICFDANHYSIPAQWMGKMLTIEASHTHLRISHGTEMVAQHRRTFNKGERRTDPDHVKALLESKKIGKKRSFAHLLISKVPETEQLLTLLQKHRQYRTLTIQGLQELLELYGTYEFRKAVLAALNQPERRDLLSQVRRFLENSRASQGSPPLLPLPKKYSKYNL